MSSSFIRFLLVGICNTMIGLSCMYLLLHIGNLSYWFSTFMGNTIGAVASYFLNKRFTFKSKARIQENAWKFIVVILVCYGFSYKIGIVLATWVLTKWTVLPHHDANDTAILIGTGLYTISNYIGQRYFVFPAKSEVHIPS